MSGFEKDIDESNQEMQEAEGGESCGKMRKHTEVKSSHPSYSRPTLMDRKRVFYTWSSRSDEVDKKAEVEIQLIYQNDEDYTKVPIMIPPSNEWESKAHQVKSLMVLDCYNEHAQQSGTPYDIFMQMILPKFTALEELHWHNAYLKGGDNSKCRFEAAIEANESILSSLRVLSLPFATTSPQELMHVCKFHNLERLDLRCSILPDLTIHGHNHSVSSSTSSVSTIHSDQNRYNDDLNSNSVTPLPYDILMEHIMSMPRLKSLNIGQANNACRSLMFQYALSQSVLSSLQVKYYYEECGGKKISMNTFEDTLGADSDTEQDDHILQYENDSTEQLYISNNDIDNMPPEQRHVFESMIDFYKEKCNEMGIDYQELRMKVATGDETATNLFQTLFKEGLMKINNSSSSSADEEVIADHINDNDDNTKRRQEEKVVNAELGDVEEEDYDFDWNKVWDDSIRDMDPQRIVTASILKKACEEMHFDLKTLIDGINAGSEKAKDQMHALMKHATFEKSKQQQTKRREST